MVKPRKVSSQLGSKKQKGRIVPVGHPGQARLSAATGGQGLSLGRLGIAGRRGGERPARAGVEKISRMSIRRRPLLSLSTGTPIYEVFFQISLLPNGDFWKPAQTEGRFHEIRFLRQAGPPSGRRLFVLLYRLAQSPRRLNESHRRQKPLWGLKYQRRPKPATHSAWSLESPLKVPSASVRAAAERPAETSSSRG